MGAGTKFSKNLFRGKILPVSYSCPEAIPPMSFCRRCEASPGRLPKTLSSNCFKITVPPTKIFFHGFYIRNLLKNLKQKLIRLASFLWNTKDFRRFGILCGILMVFFMTKSAPCGGWASSAGGGHERAPLPNRRSFNYTSRTSSRVHAVQAGVSSSGGVFHNPRGFPFGRSKVQVSR